MKRVYSFILNRITAFLFLSLLSSCEVAKTIDLNGSWYLDYGSGGIDSTMNYTEFHFKDSLLTVFDESAGQISPQKIKIVNEEIFFSDSPLYKILKLKEDTLWLRFNPELKARWDTVYWVRLPNDERGFYDYRWTEENKDSLSYVVERDYNRRMWRHYYYKRNDLKTYDSLVRSGNWGH